MLYSSLQQAKNKYSERCAVVCNGHHMSYAELLKEVDYASERFGELGLGGGQTAALVLSNSLEFIICLYALSSRHVCVVLINPQNDVEKICENLQMTHLDIVIMENHVYDNLKDTGASFPFQVILREHLSGYCRPGASKLMNRDDNLYQSRNEHAPVVIQCSSGTTGLPKMAIRTNRNLSVDTDNIISTFAYTEEDVVYCAVPVCHGYGLTMGLLAPLKAGAQIWLERWFMPNRLISDLSKTRLSVFLGTPEYYDILNRRQYSERNINLSEVRLLLCSGSPLQKETGLSFHTRYGCWIQQLYGMMEVSTMSCNLAADENNVTSVGLAVNNVLIRLGAGGEIEVFSETISESYVGDRKITPAEKHGWFRTGDRGYLDETGRLYIQERIKASEQFAEMEANL
ncbi:class I adenylate-forming enzyme family protein [Paenibacillus sp. FSL M7-0420]|uniref:class I adenylate-forming enzyme family protein n=1 Tax=Paenibacillus sp. FSL M7-0420 TaxID=2921609 RepID=UPI0030FAE097